MADVCDKLYTGLCCYYYSFRSPGPTGEQVVAYNYGMTASESIDDIRRWAKARYHEVSNLRPIKGMEGMQYVTELILRGWDRHCNKPLYEGDKSAVRWNHPKGDIDGILEFPFNVRPSVHALTKFMEYKLQKKDVIWGESWKEGDEKENPMWLLRRLREEVDELQAELEKYYSDVQSNELEIALECADVANFAMMIQDIILMEREER